jgi:hypothetical protein
LIPGTGITLTLADNADTDCVDITVAASGGSGGFLYSSAGLSGRTTWTANTIYDRVSGVTITTNPTLPGATASGAGFITGVFNNGTDTVQLNVTGGDSVREGHDGGNLVTVIYIPQGCCCVFMSDGGTTWETIIDTRGGMWATTNTTNGTTATLYTVTLDDNTVYQFEATILARQTGGSIPFGGAVATYKRIATYYRDGGGAATLVGSINNLHTAEVTASWDATFDTSTNDVRVRVTGGASLTIKWELIDFKAIKMT